MAYRDGNWRPRRLTAQPIGGGWVALHPSADGVILLAPLHVGRLRRELQAALWASAEHDADHWARQVKEHGPDCWHPDL